MADNGSEGAEGGAEGGSEVAARPEHIPEKFWDAEKGAAKVDDLAKSYTEISGRFAKGKEAFRGELAKELEAERFKNRPEKPDAYQVAMPEKGPLAERLSKNSMVILNEKPGEDFQAEEGKKYFVMDPGNPLLAYWKQTAHAQGLSNDQFMEGVAAFAEAEAARQPTADQLKAEREAEYAKLGEHGEQRAQYAWGRLKGVLGDEDAKGLEAVLFDANAVVAVEKLLEKAGEPKFSAEAAAAANGENREELLAEAKKLIGDPAYYQDPEKQNRVTEIYKMVYPGQVQTASMGPGQGY